jgi:hypothetical protein
MQYQAQNTASFLVHTLLLKGRINKNSVGKMLVPNVEIERLNVGFSK